MNQCGWQIHSENLKLSQIKRNLIELRIFIQLQSAQVISSSSCRNLLPLILPFQSNSPRSECLHRMSKMRMKKSLWRRVSPLPWPLRQLSLPRVHPYFEIYWKFGIWWEKFRRDNLKILEWNFCKWLLRWKMFN